MDSSRTLMAPVPSRRRIFVTDKFNQAEFEASFIGFKGGCTLNIFRSNRNRHQNVIFHSLKWKCIAQIWKQIRYKILLLSWFSSHQWNPQPVTFVRLIQTAAVSSGKRRCLRKMHASDAAICGEIEKILISKKNLQLAAAVWMSLNALSVVRL